MRWSEREGVRFLVAGVLNTAIGYALYLLLNLVVDYRVAYSASYAFGIVLSFIVNSVYVFKEALRWRRLAIYPAVYVLQYLVGLGCVWLFVERLAQSETLAPFFAILVGLPLTFLATRLILKGKPNASKRR